MKISYFPLMAETPNKKQSPEQAQMRSVEDVQRERNELLTETEEIQTTLEELSAYQDQVRDAIGAVNSAEGVSEQNMAKVKLLTVELQLTDAEIRKTNQRLAVLDQKIGQLDVLIDKTKKRQLDLYIAEAPVYQTSVNRWNELVEDAKLAVRIHTEAIDLSKKHPENVELASIVANMFDAMRPYGAELPKNPTEFQMKRDQPNEQRIAHMIQMIDAMTPLALRYKEIATVLQATPPAAQPTQSEQPKAETKKPEPVLTPEPEASAITPTPRVTPPAATSKAVETPQVQPAVTPLPKKEEVRTPVVASETVEGERSLPTNTTVFIRLKNSPQFFYLQPNFGNVRWTLGNFADAVRSPDRTRWIITPHGGYEQQMEFSTDGRTWSAAARQEKSNAVAPLPPSSPANQSEAPAAQPKTAIVTPEPVSELRQGEVVQTSPMTVEFPANGTSYVSYVTPYARSVRPGNFEPSTSQIDFYLYSAVQQNGRWRLTLKPNQSANVTIQTPSGGKQTVKLGAGVVMPTLSETPVGTPTVRQTPPIESVPDVPAPQPPRPIPVDAQRMTPSPAQRIPEVQPKATTVPAVPEALPQQSRPTQPDVAPTRTSKPKLTADGLEVPERIDTLFNMYADISKEYQASMKADYEKYGGSAEWKLFDQRFAQLEFDLEENFGGNSPRHSDLKAWRQLLSSPRPKGRNVALPREPYKTCAYRALTRMQALLAEYKKTKHTERAPVRPQTIDVLSGSTETMQKELDALREVLQKKGGKAGAAYDKVDRLYVEASELAKKPEDKKAILACRLTLAKNFASYTPSSGTNFLGGALGFVSDAASFRPGMSEVDFRQKLLERAERTPLNMTLTPKHVLSLVRMKRLCDEVRSRTDLTEKQRYDQYIGIIGDHSSVLEALSKESEKELSMTRMIGYNTEVAMKDVMNPDTVDWLLAAHLSAEPVKGIADSSFFYIDKIPSSEPKVATDVPEAPHAELGEPEPIVPEGIPSVKGLDLRSMIRLGEDKKKEEKLSENQRYATDEEMAVFGPKLKGDEVLIVTDGLSFGGCSEATGSCRLLKNFKTEEELKEYLASGGKSVLKPEPAPEEAKPDAAPEAEAANTEPTPQEEKKPEGPKLPELYANPRSREFRLPNSESFSVSFVPPTEHGSTFEFTPTTNTNVENSAFKAMKYNDLWVVKLKPMYEGTATLTRNADKTATPLIVKRQAENVASDHAEEITSMDGFESKVLASPVPVVLEFGASWCKPCKDMAPFLDNVAKKYVGKARVLKIDGFAGFPGLMQKYCAPAPDGERKFPTLVVFKNGKKVSQSIGMLGETGIEALIPHTDQLAGM